MDITKERLDGNTIEVATSMVSLFDSIPSEKMADYQHQDNQILPVIESVKSDQKPSKKFT